MIDAIITFSIRNRVLVVGASLVLAILGGWAAWETPVDAIPDLSENQVIVFTEWKGHGPREIEDQVTYPLTLGLRGLRGVRVVRSSSDVGFSMISVIFDDGVESAEARRRVGELLEDALGAGKATFRAAALPDGPGEPGGDRGGRRVDVVAVKAEPGFEAQRVARAEADGDDFGVGDQLVGQGFGLFGWDGDFETVLPGVAGAGHQAVDAVESEGGDSHEG